MMNLSNIVSHLPSGTIDKSSIYKAATQENHQFKMSSIFWLIRNMIDEGLLVKVGRNKYCAVNAGTSRKQYSYPFSNELQNIVTSLEANYPLMDFQAWEAFQFNYFANHQIAHNLFFIEVENMLETSIYEFLRDSYNNQVLLKPDAAACEIYAVGNTIIVQNLITEAPVDKSNPHGVVLEKLLVDMFADKKVKMFLEESEFASILENAFTSYIIDESKMFRYARRRGAEEKIRDFIVLNTNIQLHI